MLNAQASFEWVVDWSVGCIQEPKVGSVDLHAGEEMGREWGKRAEAWYFRWNGLVELLDNVGAGAGALDNPIGSLHCILQLGYSVT